jgi:hypothetical protein
MHICVSDYKVLERRLLMKIEIDGVVYEGTPDELQAFFPHLKDRALPKPNFQPPNQGVNVKEVIYQVLHRRNIPNGQRDLYRALYHVGKNGLSYSALAEAMGRTEQEIAGVLGALGRRVNNTAGAAGDEGINLLLHIERAGDSWHYWMRDELRQILEEEGFDWLR